MTDVKKTPVNGQADLHELWQLLMQPLGFSSTSLWLLALGADSRPLGLITEIAEMPPTATGEHLSGLAEVVAEVYADEPGCSIAFLLSRPGAAALTEADLSYAHGLRSAMGGAGIATWPLHVATDEAVVVVPPDALAAAG